MADQKYTPIGVEIWRWFRRWKNLDSDGKVLCLFLLTSREAKVSVPGLWCGSVYAMAESGLTPNTAHNALDSMIRMGLAQHDPDNQLVRLTELPDFLDRAHTEQAIWGWWGRFKTLPNCSLRNVHIPLLWSMVESGKHNPKMIDTWKQTFGTVVIPTHLPAFLPLSSSDTSTDAQPSLFGSRNLDLNEINMSGPRGLPRDLRSGSGSGSGGSDPDPEDPADPVGPPRLQLVPSPVPTADDEARFERESYARDMHAIIEAAGGGSLLK